MGITVKVVARCDKCGAISNDVSPLVRGAIKLPDGWVNNSSFGILCESCQNKRDVVDDDLKRCSYPIEYPYQALYKLDKNGATLVGEKMSLMDGPLIDDSRSNPKFHI